MTDNQRTWDIALQDEQHQALRLQFDDQFELQKFIKSLSVEQLLLARIYDPDQRSMDGKTYLQYFL